MSSAAPSRDELLERLVSVISHDLRAPLAVIVGYAELLRMRDDEETRREAPVRIEEAAKRLSCVIDDILTTAELDTGNLVSSPSPVELRSAVEDAIRGVESCGEGRLFRVCGDDWPVVFADPDHLRQMLTDVLVAACAGSSEAETVAIAAGSEDGAAVVSLSGAVQAPDVGQHATGLALSVTRRLAELGGGSLSVSAGSRPALRLTIPLAGRKDRR